MNFPSGWVRTAFHRASTCKLVPRPDSDDARRARGRSSALACIGICGYLVGLTLPLSPVLDVPLVFLVVFSTLAAIAARNRPGWSCLSTVIAAAVFAFARLLSTVTAADGFLYLPVLAPLLPALLLLLVTSAWVQTARHVQAICLCLTVVAFLLVSMSLARWVTPISARGAWAGPVASPLLQVNNDITVAAVLAPLALGLAAPVGGWLVRLAVGLFFGSLIAAIGLLESRTAFVTTIVAVGSFLLLQRPPSPTVRAGRRGLLLLAALVGFLLIVDALAGFRLIQKSAGDWQGNGRVALWVAALAMFRDAPALGHGAGAYAKHYRAYIDSLQLPPWIVVDLRSTPWVHNLYLEILAEQGIVGCVAFFVLVALAVSHLRTLRRSRDPHTQVLGGAVGAALIAFLAAAVFELTLLRPWVTITLFALVGLLSALAWTERNRQPRDQIPL